VVWGCSFLQLRRLMEVSGWGYDMDYVWCCWIADCHKLHRFLQKFLFPPNTFTAMDEGFNSFSLSVAHVKPIQVLTVHVSYAKITPLNTLCRHSLFRPCDRNFFNANTDRAQLQSTLSTCSFTVRVLVAITPRIFMLSTRLISVSSAGNWVKCFWRLY